MATNNKRDLGLIFIDPSNLSVDSRQSIEQSLRFFGESEPELTRQFQQDSGTPHVYVGVIDRMMVPWNDRAVHFGDALYEACGIFNGEPYLYDKHMNRLKGSFHGMKFSSNPSNILELVEKWGRWLVKASGYEQNAILYFQISRCVAPQRAHPFPRDSIPAVYLYLKKKALPSEDHYSQGASVCLIRDQRHFYCDMKTVNLLGNVFGAEAAAARREQGEPLCFESILYRVPYSIDTPLEGGDIMQSVVTEACAASSAAVFDGVLWTHPEFNHVLPSITRRHLIECALGAGIPVKEERYTLERMLKEASEVILFGTTTGAMPIVRLYLVERDSQEFVVADGKPGPVQKRIRAFWRSQI